MASRTIRITTPPMSNTLTENFITGAQGPAQTLLKSLFVFIYPLVASKSSHAHFNLESETSSPVYNGIEGKNLLAALAKFVEAIVNINKNMDANITENEPDIHANSHDGSHITSVHERPIPQDVSNKIAPQSLPTFIVQQVYKRVFNDMPIRLLAFNSDGGALRLLDRSAIADDILSRIPRASVQDLNEGDKEYEQQLLKIVKKYSAYAILSHTWIRDSPGDVVYGDWATRELNPLGNTKITKFCRVAARDYGVSFGWMDTVCINKESSAELDESIRSMYRWYRQSSICITYLSQTVTIGQMQHDSWFTRGWTLQELLAPQYIEFYNKNWAILIPTQNAPPITDLDFDFTITPSLKQTLMTNTAVIFSGTGDVHAVNEIPKQLQYQIYKATSITRSELLAYRFADLEVLPLSRIMQLAASRHLTREEDRVYSLMGLLEVGIPVTYGEGEQRAFSRLIREIATTKSSISDIFNHGNSRHVLPTSIFDFATRSSIFDRAATGWGSQLQIKPIQPMILTHIGIRMSLLLVPALVKSVFGKIVPLNSTSTVPLTICGSSKPDDYILLDLTESSYKWISSCGQCAGNKKIIFVGIINFSQSGDLYLASGNWLCVPMGVRDNVTAVNGLRDTDPRHLVRLSGPVAISLSTKHEIRQRWNTLRLFGIQVGSFVLH